MKKHLVLLIFSTLGLLLSSCGNLSKMSFTKRHYRSGYYVDFGRKSNTSITSQSTASIPAKTKHQIPSALIVTKQSNPVTVNASKNAYPYPTAPQENAKRKEVKCIKTLSTISVSNSFVPKLSTSTNSSNESASEVHARVDVNVSMVVIVLCAIFIPPLGVALMYGIDSYFWIDLILTLLFFFPGMIFALIVVLM